jgi:transcriptional regulator with XRE-family HTH domain
MNTSSSTVGDLLREWRCRRRLSQLDLAVGADISQRHLSFLESGRAQPSREMVLRLARHLSVPPRERNTLLLAAGFAPMCMERALSDPELRAAREVVELVLDAHEPYPAIAIDRHWLLVASNMAASQFFVDVAPELLQPPINVLRLSLHPMGMGPRIANFCQWRDHVLERLQSQIEVSGDPVLMELLGELKSYAAPAGSEERASLRTARFAGVAVPCQLQTPVGVLSFLSTTTVFGTPIDITLSELAIETFLPADTTTAMALRAMELKRRAAGVVSKALGKLGASAGVRNARRP